MGFQDWWPSCTAQQTTEVIRWGTCFWMQPRCMDGHPECEQIMVEKIGKFGNWLKREEDQSCLVGSSTHIQRIQRLWRDVFRCVAHIFYYTFQAMEESGLLQIDNPLHKFALHYIYLPRINRALSSFTSAWNNHPLRTENNWSPERI